METWEDRVAIAYLKSQHMEVVEASFSQLRGDFETSLGP